MDINFKTVKAIVFDMGNTLIGEYEGTMLALPGVADLLAQLQGRVKVVVGSNSPYTGEQVREFLEGYGLTNVFDAVLTSADFGAVKPNRVFFEKLLNLIDLEPSTCIMVGDAYYNDIQGAKMAGFKTVWLDMEVSSREDTQMADVIIHSMTECLDALLKLDE